MCKRTWRRFLPMQIRGDSALAIVELSGLQDRVALAPHSAVEALLAEDLKAAQAEVFASFETKPLAAASIAQVYRAQLMSGEQVVVKVQRPGIREPIERDLDILLKTWRARWRSAPPGRAVWASWTWPKALPRRCVKRLTFATRRAISPLSPPRWTLESTGNPWCISLASSRSFPPTGCW